MNNKIAIVGYGHVGKAMYQVFPDAVLFDPYKPEATGTKEEVNASDMAVVCVMTPESQDEGKTDLSIIEEVFEWLETPLIVIKSAVPVGTTDALKEKYPGKRIVISPEYFGESKYYTPPEWGILGWPFMIAGGNPEDVEKVFDIFSKKLGPQKTYFAMTAKEAELVKYVENTWGAMKVTFFNEIKSICDAMGISFWNVREGWSLDPRVEKMHTAVFEGNRGYGGKCYPKDVASLIHQAREAGYFPALLDQMQESNKAFRALNESDDSVDWCPKSKDGKHEYEYKKVTVDNETTRTSKCINCLKIKERNV